MKKTINKLLVICGPTATGKTSLALYLAKTFNGELVSADSRQVYRGMNVITGKDIGGGKWPAFAVATAGKEMSREVGCGKWVINNIPVWLYDLVKPDYRFNVSEYMEMAGGIINNILSRGKLPIVVGGTGFYLHGLFGEVDTLGIPPNFKLREKLEKLTIGELQDKFVQLDQLDKFNQMNQSDRNNPRRLIRAIEIVARKPKNPRLRGSKDHKTTYSTLKIGLITDNESLYRQIDERVEERVRVGAEEEVKKLLAYGYHWDNSVIGATIGYREWRAYFEGKAGLNDVVQKWKYAEHAYARRQMTWFKKEKGIVWFDINDVNFRKNVTKQVKKWLIC